MTAVAVYDFNEHRKANRQDKADALRKALKDLAAETGDVLDLDVNTPAGLRTLARSAWAQRADTEVWTRLAARAGVKVPGASYVEGVDPEWTRYATIRLVRDGLRRDADELELELADRAS